MNMYSFLFLLYIIKNLRLIQSRGLSLQNTTVADNTRPVPTIRFLTLCTGIWFLRDCQKVDLSFWGSVLIAVASTALKQYSIEAMQHCIPNSPFSSGWQDW